MCNVEVEQVQAKWEENPNRAIHIDGYIDESLYKRVAKEILQLRFESSEPITVYLDSSGGSVHYARQIWNLLKAPRHNKTVCKVISVVHSFCGSAASDLLINGDYVIAYPNAKIHYHGVLLPSIDEPINSEGAADLSNNLARMNDDFAFELTTNILNRLLVINFEINTFHSIESEYVRFLMMKISANNKLLIQQIENSIREMNDVIKLIPATTSKDTDRFELDVKLYKTILNYKIKEARYISRKYYESPTVNNLLLEVDNLYRDVSSLRDNRYNKIVENRKNNLMMNWDKLTVDSFASTLTFNRDQMEVLIDSVNSSLIYLTLTLCRLLLQGEHNFSAEDAYYLGLVDEVIGKSDLN